MNIKKGKFELFISNNDISWELMIFKGDNQLFDFRWGKLLKYINCDFGKKRFFSFNYGKSKINNF